MEREIHYLGEIRDWPMGIRRVDVPGPFLVNGLYHVGQNIALFFDGAEKQIFPYYGYMIHG